ncbi:helix-turn-helix domain-containing protein (plasmid) [Natrinema thermotolerans]|uniref:Helix-turn-helix domain-containing protein n=1 Tax=Natrinema thermotolerans TaxID=121872 RepID=A0AAF0PKX5_9EURY|nr:helix-turn-helix domain-containing protein [Natrinema thermotolerans]WMT10363.1 helix-turn-helix domain-containing protein [Natrinema thermotolerans]
MYDDFCDEHGRYPEQQREVDEQIDQFTVDVELIDLKPIESDRFEEFVDDKPIGADRFEEFVDDRPFYADAFTDEISDDVQAQLGWERIEESFEAWRGDVDRDELPRGKINPTTQAQLEDPVEIGNESFTDIWKTLFSIERVQTAVANCLESAFGPMDVPQVYDVLEERAVPPWIRSSLVDISREIDGAALEAVENLTTLADRPATSNEDLLVTASLAAEGNAGTPITVHFGKEFLERERRDQRDICDLLSILATGLEIRIVGSGRDLWLTGDELQGVLPGVSEWRHRRRGEAWFDDVVETAKASLDPDSRHVEILRDLADVPGQIMDRADLEALHDDVSRTRLSQVLTSEAVEDSLEQLQLIEVFGKRGDQKVELLETGSEVLSLLDNEHGVQQSLKESVSDTGNSSQQWRRTPRTRGGEGTGQPYRTAYMGRGEHAGAAAAAEPGAVTFVKGSLPDADKRERPVSYDADRDEAIVAPRAATPLQMTVTNALSLADRKLFLDKALPAERLATVFDDLDDPMLVLKTARQIGPITSDSLEEPEQLRDDLVEWGEAIESMINRLKEGDYEDRNELCSAILTSAKGLEGSIVHLLDAAGVDVVREVRVTPGLSNKKLRSLAKSIGISAAISSKYGGYAAYRQLFKVPNSAPPLSGPIADASDPVGELIGSFVIRGPDAHRLRDDLEYFLENPRELLDKPAEFTIEIPVTEPDWDAYRDVAARLLHRKRLRSTPEAISLFHALVATPHDLADALLRLPREEETRELRADDVRYVLRTLTADVLLPECGSAGVILSALLRSDEPLSQTELAERADVSTRTVRNYRDLLQGLGLLQITDEGYRLTLSFCTPEERQAEVYPEIVATDEIMIVEAADAVLENLLPPDRYGDPDDPAGGVLFWPPDPLQLADHEDFGPWITAAAALDDGGVELIEDTVVTMGPTIVQTPITSQVKV